jgi:hypothetical protein
MLNLCGAFGLGGFIDRKKLRRCGKKLIKSNPPLRGQTRCIKQTERRALSITPFHGSSPKIKCHLPYVKTSYRISVTLPSLVLMPSPHSSGISVRG